jgi:hypothetical protein
MKVVAASSVELIDSTTSRQVRIQQVKPKEPEISLSLALENKIVAQKYLSLNVTISNLNKSDEFLNLISTNLEAAKKQLKMIEYLPIETSRSVRNEIRDLLADSQNSAQSLEIDPFFSESQIEALQSAIKETMKFTLSEDMQNAIIAALEVVKDFKETVKNLIAKLEKSSREIQPADIMQAPKTSVLEKISAEDIVLAHSA